MHWINGLFIQSVCHKLRFFTPPLYQWILYNIGPSYPACFTSECHQWQWRAARKSITCESIRQIHSEISSQATLTLRGIPNSPWEWRRSKVSANCCQRKQRCVSCREGFGGSQDPWSLNFAPVLQNSSAQVREAAKERRGWRREGTFGNQEKQVLHWTFDGNPGKRNRLLFWMSY